MNCRNKVSRRATTPARGGARLLACFFFLCLSCPCGRARRRQKHAIALAEFVLSFDDILFLDYRSNERIKERLDACDEKATIRRQENVTCICAHRDRPLQKLRRAPYPGAGPILGYPRLHLHPSYYCLFPWVRPAVQSWNRIVIVWNGRILWWSLICLNLFQW